jgi:hypothetical protein
VSLIFKVTRYRSLIDTYAADEGRRRQNNIFFQNTFVSHPKFHRISDADWLFNTRIMSEIAYLGGTTLKNAHDLTKVNFLPTTPGILLNICGITF